MNAVIMMGLTDFFRSVSKEGSLPRSDFRDNSERSLYSAGLDHALFNGVIEKNEISLKHHDVNEVVNFFNSKKLPFVWWTNSKFLETQGFQFGGTMKGIALDITKGKPIPSAPPLNVKVKTVNTEQELNVFSRIIADCFGLNSQIEQQYTRVNKTAMDRKEQIHFLAYLDGIPVSTATLATLPKSAGIWNCATLPAYRKRGIGTFLCSAASIEAKKMNYQQIMAILMPKGLAWGLFNNLGYKEVTTLPFYVYGASANELEK
jgi:ribosomal protein S18 acetylase RimI-like enzyme